MALHWGEVIQLVTLSQTRPFGNVCDPNSSGYFFDKEKSIPKYDYVESENLVLN